MPSRPSSHRRWPTRRRHYRPRANGCPARLFHPRPRGACALLPAQPARVRALRHPALPLYGVAGSVDVAYTRLRVDVALVGAQPHRCRQGARDGALPVPSVDVGIDTVRAPLDLLGALAGDGGWLHDSRQPLQRMGVPLTRRLRGGTERRHREFVMPGSKAVRQGP